MTNFLINLFVKNKEDVKNSSVRIEYGNLSGGVGIIANIILFAGKLIVGLLSSSISIMADAFNNISDAGSAVVSLIGFKMSSKPADREHPFGHGRFEYISGFIISIMIIMAGIEIGKTSFEKIINPQNPVFEISAVIILVVSMFVKFWLFLFNNKISRIIDSQTIAATAKDSFNDVGASGIVLIGVFLSTAFNINIDGFLGLILAILIFITGISSAKSMIDQLVGKAPSKEYIDSIKDYVLEYDIVRGVHDVIVHNYGVGRSVISLHAEVPCDIDILKIHDEIDNIENDMKNHFICDCVIHMDPIDVNDEQTLELGQKVKEIINEIDEEISMHDFRIVSGESHTNLIFDVCIPFQYKIKDDDLIQMIEKEIKNIDEKYNSVISIDKE